MLNCVVACFNYVAERQTKYSKKRGVPGCPQGAVGNLGPQKGGRKSMGSVRGFWEQGHGGGWKVTGWPPRLRSADMPAAVWLVGWLVGCVLGWMVG